MAHNIMGDRFYGWRQPVWHGLGLVTMDQLTPLEAFERIGAYETGLAPIKVEVAPGVLVSTDGWQAIVRQPTKDDNVLRVFNVVDHKYRHVTPRRLLELAEQHVRGKDGKPRPVETLGFLGQGESGFLTYTLPSTSIRGEEIIRHLFIDADFSGESSIYVRAPVDTRVVCANTVAAARNETTEFHRIHHRGDVHRQIADVLDGIYERALDKAAAIQEAYETLASYRTSQDEQLSVIQTVYPDPSLPRRSDDPKVAEQRQRVYELRVQSVMEHRQAVVDVLAGGGRPESMMDNPAIAGSAWWLLQGINEVVDWGSRRGKVSAASATISEVRGEKATLKEKAWDAVMELVGTN